MGYENTTARIKELKEKNDALSHELARVKSQFTGMGAQVESPGDGMYAGSGFHVGTPGEYKGYKLRAEIATLRAKRPALDEIRAERIAKGFLDWVEGASHTKAGMNEGTTTAGGWLTPDEFSDEWSAYVREESVALQFCRVVGMTSDVKYVNKEGDTVFSLDGIKITAEANAATEVSPTVDRTTLTAKRLDGYVRVTVEDLDDMRVRGGFVNQLLDQFSEALGQKIDSAVFVGSGDPCSGLFKSAGYSQVFGTGSAAFSMLLESDLRAIVAKTLKSRRGRWYMSKSTLWMVVYNLKDSQNRPLFVQNPAIGGSGGLWGYPVQEVYKAPDTSAASTGFILFGDLDGFLIGERQAGTSLLVDPYTRSLSHETIFALFARYAFAQHEPLKYGRIVTAA